MKLDIFGKVDYNDKGQVKSEFPAWFFTTLIEQLHESVESNKRALRDGRIPTDAINDTKQELALEEARLADINKSIPKLNDKERDTLNKIYKILGNKIQEAMFTRSEMMKGTASPREEVKRMSEHCVNVSDIAEIGDLAECCNVPIKDKKLTRKGAEKIFKIAGKILNLPTNTEVLRKDSVTKPLFGV